MSEEWFFSRDGQEYGPCSSQDLQTMAGSGQLLQTDLIWKEGMSSWVAANTVKALFDGSGPGVAAAASSTQASPKPQAAAAEPSPMFKGMGQAGGSTKTSGGVRQTSIPQKFRAFLSSNETVLYASNPSESAKIISMVFAGIGALGFGAFGAAGGIVGILIVWMFSVPIAAVIAYMKWKHQFYIITNRRTIVSQGIFNVAVKILPNQNITMISVNTGIIDRWLGLNTIELSSAGGGGGIGVFAFFPGLSPGNVSLRWVANAPQVVSLIRT